ncbi:terpene synthase family protein [Chitinophaga solisilvae]|uniref:terpene synthase family protein n=1 Tax=Chitinophaga solisilvae TaxID=1233460 RepID=UPI00136B10CD|nr:hypothetical protein [Chitinophaga solisilvae]
MKTQTFHTPFHEGINPLAAQLQIETNAWLYSSFHFLDQVKREQYLAANFSNAIARSFPHLQHWEQLCIFSKYLLWATLLEDHCMHTCPEKIRTVCDRIMDIFNGDLPDTNDHELVQLSEYILRELSVHASAEWVARFTTAFKDYYYNGLMAAYSFMEAQTFPPLQLLKLIRPRASGSYAYLTLLEIANDAVVPDEIFNHPVTERLRTLTARIMAWENDFYSMEKKINTPEKYTNLILVMQQHMGCSAQAAMEASLALKNADLEEFTILQNHIPDFGMFNAKITSYLNNAAGVIQVARSWYKLDTKRYS